MLDLHPNGDGTFSLESTDKPADSGSVCVTFTAVAASATGLVP